MKDLKIRVDNDAESREVQELFFELGYKWFSGGNQVQHIKQSCSSSFGYLVAWSSGCFTDVIQCGCGNEDAKEITLPELRDLVVLKRNDATDCTHWHVTGQANLPYLFAMDEWYFFGRNGWEKSTHTHEFYNRLKPIEKPMKEYLRKNNDGEYILEVTNERESQEPHAKHWIEIPEGTDFVTEHTTGTIHFWRKGSYKTDRNNHDWIDMTCHNEKYDAAYWCEISPSNIIWQRHTHHEELPFIDDEPLQSLNDQYAEIEKVRQSHRTASETSNPTIKETLNQRQSQYGSFEDVAMFTEQMVDVMRKGYYEKLAYNQKMALYMICSKMARIVNGNPNHKDSWHDIAGYATLIDNELVSEKDMPF